MFENISQAKLKICEYGKNNKQSYDYAFFNQLNKHFDFVVWVIKTPCVFYFRSVKFHYVKEIHDINSILTLVKIAGSSIPAQKTIKQIFVKICWKAIENTDSDLKLHVLHYANELLVLAFQKLLQTRQTSRNNKKLCKKGFWLWLIIL